MPAATGTITMPAHEVLAKASEHLQLLYPSLTVNVPFQGTLMESLGLVSTQLSTSAQNSAGNDILQFHHETPAGSHRRSASAVNHSASTARHSDSAVQHSQGVTVVCRRPDPEPKPFSGGIRNPPPSSIAPYPSEYSTLDEAAEASRRLMDATVALSRNTGNLPISLLSLHPNRLCNSVPSVRGRIAFAASYNDPPGIVYQTGEINLVWDTGCAQSMVALECIPVEVLPELRIHGRVEGDDLVLPMEVTLVSVKRVFRSFIRVRPQKYMPSAYLGVLLGQDDFLRRFKFTLTSAEVALMEGRQLEHPDCWGLLDLHTYKLGRDLVVLQD